MERAGTFSIIHKGHQAVVERGRCQLEESHIEEKDVNKRMEIYEGEREDLGGDQ